MNPGDIILYWRSGTARSIAMEGAVQRVSLWAQSFDTERGITRVTLYGGFIQFDAPAIGDLNTYGADGQPSEPEAVVPVDHLPSEDQFPVTAIFRLPVGSLFEHLPPCRVEGQLVADPMFTIRFLPGAVMTICENKTP